MASTDALVAQFKQLGFNDQKARETANNKRTADLLLAAMEEINATDATYGTQLYALASSISVDATPHLIFIARQIGSGKLKTTDQVAAAIKFVEGKTDINMAEFEPACGVGIEVSVETIRSIIDKVVEEKKDDIQKKKHAILGVLLGALRNHPDLRWAHTPTVKTEVESKLLSILGPKEDPKAAKKEKKAPIAKANTAAAAPQPTKQTVFEMAKSFKFVEEGQLAQLHKPGGNPQINPQLMKEHLERTGGRVVTRFPPEPNGFLHIGHAKAINVNFGYAQAHGGKTYLRYDDTNPEAEEEKYFTSILETVEWLGFKPADVTYSSDHFQKLYDLAVDLIKRDKAYVCHCTGEEIHAHRGGDAKGPRTDCIHRCRPISESLLEFERMKKGEYKEGEAILRMKMDMSNPNPQFWDLVAYRVLFSHHYRSGDEWCIYPTYDYTHCLCDSFEDITHSLCTTEFQLSRESYYWLVDALEIYKPVQWEYGRLNLTYAILSKRKLLKLVNEGFVNGWDDPRLYTLIAVRRRGFTPEAINAFVREIGVTTSNSVIPIERLENYVRDHLNEVAPRLMALETPLKVTLENMDADFYESLTVPNKPRDEAMGSHHVPLTRVLYIDASDFKEEEDPNFFRLKLGQSVGLLYVPWPITATEVVKDAEGKVVEIKARYEVGVTTKPKAYIQWVAESERDASPVKVEIRNYSNLFLHPNPMDKKEVPGGWLTDINPNSLEIVKNAFVEVGIRSAKVEDKYQFVRMGYYCVDKDSDLANGSVVVNRTVTLKEDSKK